MRRDMRAPCREWICTCVILILIVLPGISCMGNIHRPVWLEFCNKTILPSDADSHRAFKLKLASTNNGYIRKNQPFFCTYKFKGRSNDVIKIRVTDIRAGYCNDTSKKAICKDGFLEIRDVPTHGKFRDARLEQAHCGSNVHSLPVALCGFNTKLHKSYTLAQSHVAEVQFRLQPMIVKNRGFTLTVEFEELDRRMTYPYTPTASQGTLHCQSRKTENCMGRRCSILSPGFPSHNMCYLLESSERLKITMSPWIETTYTGKRKSKKKCVDDYILLYDGRNDTSPLIGRFCPKVNPVIVISSGSAVLMKFISGNAELKQGYDGFKVLVEERWKHLVTTPSSGVFKEPCGWTFSSAPLVKTGEINMPDHYLDRKNPTRCRFEFIGKQNERISLNITINGLRKGEMLRVKDHMKMNRAITSKDVKKQGKPQHFIFVSNSSHLTVDYRTKHGQYANEEFALIKFTFHQYDRRNGYSVIPKESTKRPRKKNGGASPAAGSSRETSRGVTRNKPVQEIIIITVIMSTAKLII